MTYTVLALDRDRSAIGVATASCALAVGAAVPSLDPRVGAVASQAWTNELLRGRVLGALRGGDSPAAALSRLDSWEAEVELRQVGVLGVDGRGAAFTGRATTAWRGHEIDDGVVALGNVHTGPEVLDAMRGALRLGARTLPRERQSWPRRWSVRWRQARPWAGTRGSAERGGAGGAVGADVLEYDLRVDDAADPVGELARLVQLRAGVIARRR